MTTNWIKAVCLTALLTGATACSSEQKADGGGDLLADIGQGLGEVISIIPFIGDKKDEAPPEPKLLADVDATVELDYRVQWQIDLGLDAGEHVEMLTPLPGQRVAILESGNIVHLVDARSGNTLWRRSIGQASEVFTLPQIEGGNLLLCSQSQVYTLRLEDGATIGVLKFPALSAQTPLIQDGIVVSGSPSGLLFAQELATGIVRWRYQMSSSVMAPIIMSRGMVIATDGGGNVAVLGISQGRIIWRSFRPPWGATTAAPTTSSESVFIANEDQKLYAFDRAGGSVVWEYIAESKLSTAPVVFRNKLLQYVPNRGLVAIDTLTGDELWRSPKVSGTPVQLNGRTLMVFDGSDVRLVDFDNGELIDTVGFPRADRLITDAKSNGSIYLIRDAGKILKLGPR